MDHLASPAGMAPLTTGRSVAVIGAGWAGIAAAVWARAMGLEPILYEASASLGGRARAVGLEMAGEKFTVDNGQHLMMGAYRETFALHDLVMQARRTPGGAPAPTPYSRSSFSLSSAAGWSLSCDALPSPWHLIKGLLLAKGIPWPERLRMARLLDQLKRNQWNMGQYRLVADWLAAPGQSDWLRQSLWNPLCVATLNTPVEQACAQTFAHVLRDSLGATAQAIEPVFADPTLSAFLPDPALAWLTAQAVEIQTGAIVRRVIPHAGKWQVQTANADRCVDQVIVCTTPKTTLRLLQDCPHPTARQWLDQFELLPIASIYLAWREHEAPAIGDWLMLQENPAAGEFGQWLFRRDVQKGFRLACVVISAAGRGSSFEREAMVQAVIAQVTKQLASHTGQTCHAPAAARLVLDPQATFACTPDRPKPRANTLQSELPGVWLAGDYCWSEYPATLESAVRSGKAAALAAHHYAQSAASA